MRSIEVFIEIPKGSRNKYEYDHASGCIRLDRVLFSSVHYPTDYGYVVGTTGSDGDPLDALVLVEEPTFPGCRVQARPIGVLRMKDQGQLDQKVLAVPEADPRFHGVSDLADLQVHWPREIENFFNTYKMLEGRETSVDGWGDSEEANRLLERSLVSDDRKPRRCGKRGSRK